MSYEVFGDGDDMAGWVTEERAEEMVKEATEPLLTVARAALDLEQILAKCAKQTHCIRGHKFTPSNTYHPHEGGRACRKCQRIHDMNRPPRGSDYWRRINAKRKGAQCGY